MNETLTWLTCIINKNHFNYNIIFSTSSLFDFMVEVNRFFICGVDGAFTLLNFLLFADSSLGSTLNSPKSTRNLIEGFLFTSPLTPFLRSATALPFVAILINLNYNYIFVSRQSWSHPLYVSKF